MESKYPHWQECLSVPVIIEISSVFYVYQGFNKLREQANKSARSHSSLPLAPLTKSARRKQPQGTPFLLKPQTRALMRTWDVALTGEQRDFIGVRPCREFLAFNRGWAAWAVPVAPCCGGITGWRAHLPCWSGPWRSGKPGGGGPLPPNDIPLQHSVSLDSHAWCKLAHLTSHGTLLYCVFTTNNTSLTVIIWHVFVAEKRQGLPAHETFYICSAEQSSLGKVLWFAGSDVFLLFQ